MPTYQLKLLDRTILDAIDQITVECWAIVSEGDSGSIDFILTLRQVCRSVLRIAVAAADVCGMAVTCDLELLPSPLIERDPEMKGVRATSERIRRYRLELSSGPEGLLQELASRLLCELAAYAGCYRWHFAFLSQIRWILRDYLGRHIWLAPRCGTRDICSCGTPVDVWSKDP